MGAVRYFSLCDQCCDVGLRYLLFDECFISTTVAAVHILKLACVVFQVHSVCMQVLVALA